MVTAPSPSTEREQRGKHEESNGQACGQPYRPNDEIADHASHAASPCIKFARPAQLISCSGGQASRSHEGHEDPEDPEGIQG
jgi:hypothetical protein